MRIKTHPGEVLKEEFISPLSLSARHLASELCIPHTRITDILKEKRTVTADTAIRFATYFGTTPEFWMSLQAEHDLSKEMSLHAQEYESIPALAFG